MSVDISVHVITYCWTTPLACSSLKASHWKVTLVDVVSMTLKLLGATFGDAKAEYENSIKMHMQAYTLSLKKIHHSAD